MSVVVMELSTALLAVIVTICGLINQSTTSSPHEVNTKKYIYWMKEDLTARHNFFPVRALEEERLTNQAAVEAVASFSNNMNSSLSSILAFQTKEFLTAQLFMNKTEAEGCVNSQSNFLNNAIHEALQSYTDCAYDANSKLSRLSKKHASVNSTYWAAYSKALSGIDECAGIYRNKQSYTSLKSCVGSMIYNYDIERQKTLNNLFLSPSMKFFEATVVECASHAAEAVVEKGSEFLGLLKKCSNVTVDDDLVDYEQHLIEWNKLKVNLKEQIYKAKGDILLERSIAEFAMKDYFELKREALDEYVVVQRKEDFYKDTANDYMNDYFNTVTSTALDNPDAVNCTSVSTSALDSAVAKSANESARCYAEIVKNGTSILERLHLSFTHINSILPLAGNVAILKCLSQGYVFAPDTIRDCLKITSTTYDIDYLTEITEVMRLVVTLREYRKNFQAGSNTPCGSTSLQRLYLEGERTLYDLQRCLYIHSGTTYQVTTPRLPALEMDFNRTPETSFYIEDDSDYTTTSSMQ